MTPNPVSGLHWSCKLGRLDMAKILLEAGSEVNMKSNSGHTPLHLAAQTGKRDLIELLLRYGACSFNLGTVSFS